MRHVSASAVWALNLACACNCAAAFVFALRGVVLLRHGCLCVYSVLLAWRTHVWSMGSCHCLGGKNNQRFCVGCSPLPTGISKTALTMPMLTMSACIHCTSKAIHQWATCIPRCRWTSRSGLSMAQSALGASKACRMLTEVTRRNVVRTPACVALCSCTACTRTPSSLLHIAVIIYMISFHKFGASKVLQEVWKWCGVIRATWARGLMRAVQGYTQWVQHLRCRSTLTWSLVRSKVKDVACTHKRPRTGVHLSSTCARLCSAVQGGHLQAACQLDCALCQSSSNVLERAIRARAASFAESLVVE
jgi:hypothetical protein